MVPRRRRPLRAVFFDAGNTLLSMNYPAVVAQIQALGVAATVEAVQRAEWRARVRLDADLFTPATSGATARPGPPRSPASEAAPRSAGSESTAGTAGRGSSRRTYSADSASTGTTSTESVNTAGRYVRHVLAELGIRDTRVIEAMVAWRQDFNRPLGLWTMAAPGAAEALGAVRDAGIGAAVISNSNGLVESILASAGLGAGLDFVVDSGTVGVEKPDPGIFRLALARAGIAADEAAYVGDLYSIDVLGARGAGLDAVLLDPGGHWGRRDCLTAPDVLAAVRLLLAAPADGS